MSSKKELTDALIREVKYLLRNENQTRESWCLIKIIPMSREFIGLNPISYHFGIFNTNFSKR